MRCYEAERSEQICWFRMDRPMEQYGAVWSSMERNKEVEQRSRLEQDTEQTGAYAELDESFIRRKLKGTRSPRLSRIESSFTNNCTLLLLTLLLCAHHD